MLQMGASAGLAPEQASFLISMIGITNTVGRVAIGWVSDIPCVSPLVVNLVSLLISKSSLVFSNFSINEIIVACSFKCSKWFVGESSSSFLSSSDPDMTFLLIW